jgi:hypothetical protein
LALKAFSLVPQPDPFFFPPPLIFDGTALLVIVDCDRHPFTTHLELEQQWWVVVRTGANAMGCLQKAGYTP